MRILLINDISCVGKCSLTVELPLVSLGGETVDILPTSILSTHTGGFTGYTFRDLSEDFPSILKHWKSLGIKYDYIVSGYLANISQIELVKQIKKEFLKDSGIYICDPSCGDNGKLYVGFDENFIKDYLYTKDIPDPDLIIRTSGESRLSNFLMYQASYSELYFTNILWPDFSKDNFKIAIDEYSNRNIRYGCI